MGRVGQGSVLELNLGCWSEAVDPSCPDHLGEETGYEKHRNGKGKRRTVRFEVFFRSYVCTKNLKCKESDKIDKFLLLPTPRSNQRLYTQVPSIKIVSPTPTPDEGYRVILQ
jgi:hypothetical protein